MTCLYHSRGGDVARILDQIDMNPVKPGYVETRGEWPWSIFQRNVSEGWLDPDWRGASPVDLPDVHGE